MFFEDDDPSEDKSDWGRLAAANNALKAELDNKAASRPWKKKAVNFMVTIFELQQEIENGRGVPSATLEFTLRQIDDLLNQLNRY